MHHAHALEQPAASAPRPWRWLLPGAIVVLAYLVTLLHLPLDGFWVCDNGAKFIQLQGLLRTGCRVFSIPWSGAAVDPDYAFAPLAEPFGRVVHGRLFCQYSPFFALLSTVPFRLLGSVGLYVLPLAGGLLTLVPVWRLSALLPGRRIAQPLALLLVALATPMWFYSLTFWEHTPAVACLTWSILFCVEFLTHQRMAPLLAGAVCCGIAIYFRDELYLCAPVLTALVLGGKPPRWCSATFFALALAITVLPLWCLHWLTLGTPFGYHFAGDSFAPAGLLRHVLDRWPVVRNLLLNVHGNAVLSAAIALPCVLLWLLHPRVSPPLFRRLIVIVALGALLAGGILLADHLLSPDPVALLTRTNGLFAVSPILLLAFVREKIAPPSSAAGRPDAAAIDIRRTLWLALTAYVLLYALLAPEPNSRGCHWGCRFLLPAYPLMAILAAGTIARWYEARTPRPGAVALVALTLALSIAMQVYSLHLLYGRMAFWSRLNHVVAQRPEPVLICDAWFTPMELSHVFYDKTIFLTHGPKDLARLREQLWGAGYHETLLISPLPPRAPVPANGQQVADDLNFSRYLLQPLSPGP